MAMFPLGITAELLVNGTWTDISQYCYQRDGLHITGGAVNWGDTPTPATATFTVNNRDGRFSPGNLSGAYYPYLTRAVQVRFTVTATSSSGNFYTGYRFTGEVAKWPPLSDISGHDVYVQVTAAGPLRRISQAGGQGSALTRYYASLPGVYAPAAYWPCEEDTGNTGTIGAGMQGGASMTVLSGTPSWKAVSSFNGSAPVGVLNGSVWDGLTGSFGTSGDDIYLAPGSYRWVSGVSSVNAKVWAAGAGGANGGGRSAGGGGELAQEATLAVTPGTAYTVVVGAGGQGGSLDSSGTHTRNGTDGASSSFQGDSVLVLAHGGKGLTSSAGGTGSVNTVHHDGGAGGAATAGNGGAGGGSSGGTVAAGNPGSTASGNTGGAGGAAPAGGAAGGRGGDAPADANGQSGVTPGGGGGGGTFDFNSGAYHGGFPGGAGKVELVYTPATAPANNVVRFILFVPKHGGNNNRVLVRALTSGTIARLDVQYVTGGKLRMLGYNSGATLLFTSGNLTVGDGQTLMVSAELATSGSSVAWKLTAIIPGAAAAIGSVTGTQATASVGNVSEVLAGPNGDITKTAIGHISVQYALIDITKVSRALNGHDTELTADRLIRLANEQALDNQTQFAEAADHWGFEPGVQGWTGSNASVAQSGVTAGTATAATYSGQVTSPGTGVSIVFVTVVAATYTVAWSVSLSGTLGAGDANNFGLYNGATFVATSVNPAVAGTYPQAPQTFTVAAGVPDIKIISGAAGTAGAVYGASFTAPWTFSPAAGPPNDGSYFIIAAGWIGLVNPGDVCVSALNPGVKFTVKSIGAPALGFAPVNVLPMAKVLMDTTDTVTQVVSFTSTPDITPVWPTEGAHSLLITAAGGAGLWYGQAPVGTGGQPVLPGDVVSAAADVYAPAALGAVYLSMAFYNTAGTFISSVASPQIAMAAGDVRTVHIVNAPAPALAAFFNLAVADNETVAAGTRLYADHVRVAPRMGPQTRKEHAAFLKEIRELDQGILKESRILMGLGYRSRISMINQPAAVTLDYSAGTLSPPLAPVTDLQHYADIITVRRKGGSKVAVRNPGGSGFGPPGTGTVPSARKQNQMAAAADTQLAALAQHLLNIASAPDARYPTVTVNLARASLPGNAVAPLMSAVAGVEIGDRIVLSNLPAWCPGTTASQLVIGYDEVINSRSWQITWNCVPESPWEIVATALRRW